MSFAVQLQTTYNFMKTLLLLLLTLPSFAQDLKSQAEDIVLGNRVELVYYTQATRFTSELLTSFMSGDEEGMDQYLEDSPKGWYSSVDVYLAETEDVLLNEMRNDDSACFRSPKVNKVQVCHSGVKDSDGNIIWLLIVVVSY